MKVLHLLNSGDSGAGRAVYRLQKGLQKAGVTSQMLVQKKFNDDNDVIEPRDILWRGLYKLNLPFHLDAAPLKFYRQRKRNIGFSAQWMPDAIIPRVAELAPDIINIHWICHGYLQIETIPKFKKPLVWTFHDMWPFTGGCFYSGNCERYKGFCGACPQLCSNRDSDLSNWVWKRKANTWKNLNLTIVTPSRWLADCAGSSALFKKQRIQYIPNGLDTKIYKPINKQEARLIYNLPREKNLILFGAMYPFEDSRKGFHLLQSALQGLSKSGWGEKLEILIFGMSKPLNTIDLGFKTHYLGYLNDDISLAMAYSAADVTIIPSIQEAFGQTASESLACGTPVVAFDTSGLKDIVEHQRNGYRARAYDVEDLAKGIIWVLEDEQRRRNLSLQARDKAEKEFSLEIQARAYLELYEEILRKTSSS